MDQTTIVKVERETYEKNGKTYFSYFIRGNVRGREVRAAVVPIIFVAALKLRKGAFSYGVCRWVTVIGCIFSLVLNVNCVWIIVFGMMCGFLISWWKGGSL